MPTIYKRKITGASRGAWSEEKLKEAFTRMEAGDIGVNEAARYYGIPSRTLRRRRQSGNTSKISLGPQGLFGMEQEKRLVKHIQRLEKAGFAPDRETIRTIAYQLAEKLGLAHPFNAELKMAGYDWLNSFLRRNPELSVRQSQGLSAARGEGMNRESVSHFFKILSEVFKEHDFFTRPANVYNMDESGCQLNNVPGKVLATKGAKDVHVLTSTERGENITVIACCNAEGQFLPPAVIFKGVREKKEFSDGLPPGSVVFMNEKSSYISTAIFFKWLTDHFIPRKPPGKTLLILDGHASHVNCYDLLEYADNHDVIMLCLPSHTTQALQPLDRSFFKPLKHYFKQEAKKWIAHHPGRTIARIQAASLIGKAWTKAASVDTAVNGFRETGIFPMDPSAIPDHFFNISDGIIEGESQNSKQPPVADDPCSIPGTSSEALQPIVSSKNSKMTPTKLLHQISPVPYFRTKARKVKQTAKVLTFSEHVKERKMKLKDKIHKVSKTVDLEKIKENLIVDDDQNRCLECEENYFTTKLTVDWIKCCDCVNWLHESCTMYGNLCNKCGRAKLIEGKKKSNF